MNAASRSAVSLAGTTVLVGSGVPALIALCLALSGLVLYPMVGSEAWDPSLRFLNALPEASVDLIAMLGGVSITLLIAASLLGKRATDKAGSTRLVCRINRFWTTTFVRTTPDFEIIHKSRVALQPRVALNAGQERLIVSTGTTTVARPFE